MSDRLWS